MLKVCVFQTQHQSTRFPMKTLMENEIIFNMNSWNIPTHIEMFLIFSFNANQIKKKMKQRENNILYFHSIIILIV